MSARNVLAGLTALLWSAAMAYAQPTTLTIKTIIVVDATSDTPVVEHTERITKMEKTGRKVTKTETQEQLLEGIVGGLGKVNLLMDGWVEAGKRVVGGKSYSVFTRTVEHEVDEERETVTGTGKVRFTLASSPKLEGPAKRVELKASAADLQISASSDDVRARLRQAVDRFIADLNGHPVGLTTDEQDRLLGGDRAVTLDKAVAFSFLGETGQVHLKIRARKQRVIEGPIGE